MNGGGDAHSTGTMVALAGDGALTPMAALTNVVEIKSRFFIFFGATAHLQ